MDSILSRAIEAVMHSEMAFAKFITANDTGATGSHQVGFHLPKNTWRLFFDEEGLKGTNKEKFVTIRWQEDFETSSRFIYYGVGTRNEYRLTRFGRNFPFLEDDHIGSLLVITKINSDFYKAYVLASDEEIDDFVSAVNISVKDVNGILPKQYQQTSEDVLLNCFNYFIETLKVDFPSTLDLSENARLCYNKAFGISKLIIQQNPDREILGWLDAEFQLFKSIENNRYSKRIQTPFKTVEELIETANSILNRRKSRAGKSLEHHLSEVFRLNDLPFENQAVSEQNKRPDFIFPSAQAYSNPHFSDEKLVVLAAKTTCKDRWRQVLNEADRVKTKHLFTLQQGISRNQLEEMYKYDVCLIVPKPYVNSFPADFRDRILTLDKFISHLKFIGS